MTLFIHWPWNLQKKKNKHKTASDKRDDFTFPVVSFPLIRGNIPAPPACVVELTFHSSYAILGLVPNILIFSELSCWHKSYPSKLTPRTGNRVEIYISQMTFNIFTFSKIIFFSTTDKTFTGLDWVPRWVC